MKVKNLKMIYCIILVLVNILILSSFNYVSAALAKLSVPSSVTAGETITVTVSGRAEQWELKVTVDGTQVAETNNLTNESSEIAINATGTYKTTEAGTVTFKLTGSYSYTDNNGVVQTVEVNESKNVTVNPVIPPPVDEPDTPETPDTPDTPDTPTTPDTPNTPETPTTPETPVTPVEPNFTGANKTMYSKDDINLRDSWSTSSKSTRIEKGTELTVIATSTDKVNDYVWYRVRYNGETKYVAGYLLTETKPEEEKSNNNSLKSLTIENQDLQPAFSKDVTSYTLEVINDVTSLQIKAEAEDEKASVSVKGNEDLKIGENVVTISVSAENGDIKIYEIKVTRKEKEALGLEKLEIKDTDIAKKFKVDLFEYEIDIENLDKLEIEAIANREDAVVEILGNEDLQEGENTITIIVKAKDEEEKEETVTYQITVNKTLVDNTDTVVPLEEKKISPMVFVYGGISLLFAVILVVVVIYFVRNRNKEKSTKYAYENKEFEGFPGELPEKSEKIIDKYEINDKKENKETDNNINYFLDDNGDDEIEDKRGKHF